MLSHPPAAAVPAIFLHVPKTAGTTLRGLLHQRLGDGLCWYRRSDSRQPMGETHPRYLTDLAAMDSPAAWAGVQVLGGHFPAWQLPQALREQRPLLMAVLRDPLPRLESLYAYICRETAHPLHATLSGLTFHQALVGTPFGRLVAQGQLRFLRTRQQPGWDPSQLAPYPVLIGKHGALPAFVAALARRTGIELNLGDLQSNVSPSGYRDEIAAQPDHADACRLVAQLTADEQAFLASFDEVYQHEAGDGPIEIGVRRAPRAAAVPTSPAAPAAPVSGAVSPEREARRQARREARRAERQADRRRQPTADGPAQ